MGLMKTEENPTGLSEELIDILRLYDRTIDSFYNCSYSQRKILNTALGHLENELLSKVQNQEEEEEIRKIIQTSHEIKEENEDLYDRDHS